MHPDPACFIGIDIGTQGARAVLMDHQGNLLASGEEGFPLSDDSREEQSPEDWWKACLFTLRELIRQAGKNAGLTTIKAIAVTSTSGTVIPLDNINRPLHAALMYSDKRSQAEAPRCQATRSEERRVGKGCGSTGRFRWSPDT